MTIEEYKKIRNKATEFVYKILKFKESNRNDMIFAAKKLGFWNGEEMIFKDEDESDILMDYLVYEKDKKGRRLINLFYDSDIELSDEEEEILQGQVDFHSSLFEIKDFDRDNYEVTLIDLLDKERKVYKLTDMGFSHTCSLGSILYTRLIPIRDIYMTSGVSFGFKQKMKDRVLKDISSERFKKRKNLNSSDLYVLLYKKMKIYGIKTVKMELHKN